jgi:glycerate 2-kinase
VKELLRRLFADTTAVLDVARWMPVDKLRSLARHPILVLAFGKASRAMAQAVVDALPGADLRGLVVPPEPDDTPLPPFEVLPGGHPLPTAGSVRAATRALELARGARREDVVLFLVSGGGSAILELPGDPSVTIEEHRALYRALIGSGADIASINTVRRHLSAVKGGRLALAAAAAHRHLTLAISDVPHDRASSLASGPTAWEDTSLTDCLSALDRWHLWGAVPPQLRARLSSGELPPPWRAEDAGDLGRRSEFWVLLDERVARMILQSYTQAAGLHPTVDLTTDDRPFENAALHLLRRLDRLHRRHVGRPVAIVCSGELSVPLPPDPGIGGRNQQFVLACARRIRGQPITVLSAGTDGIDGNSPAAGALADGTTMARARAAGFDVHDALARCDAFPLLHALGDTIVTGPTGTNVRDLRILVHHG